MITVPAPDPKRDSERATAELKERMEERRRDGVPILVPDAAGGDPIPWE